MKTRKSEEIIPENLYMFAVPKIVHYIRCRLITTKLDIKHPYGNVNINCRIEVPVSVQNGENLKTI